MAIVVPEFPEVVDDVIWKTVCDLWHKYPSFFQADAFVNDLVKDIAEQFKEELRLIPPAVLASRFKSSLVKKAYGV